MGLPFPNEEIAFENTRNKYLVDPSGSFSTTFSYPNSYYSEGLNSKIISSIYVILEGDDNKKQFIRFELKDRCNLKTLINRESRKDPSFYSKKEDLLPLTSAYNTMCAYKYIKENFNVA